MPKIHHVNGSDRGWTRHNYILWFGAYGATYMRVYANSLEAALDIAGDWIEENVPGLLCNELVEEAYNEAIADGESEEQAYETATADVTILDCNRYLLSYEWGIVAEDPTRETVLDIQSR